MSEEREISLELCTECGARCCRHVALEIDQPTCKSDYDNIRWYLMHKNVNVFYDDSGTWYLEFKTVCDNLGKDGACTSYSSRPRVCRSYPAPDEWCEYQSDELPYKKKFSRAAEFEKWLEKKNRRWRFKRDR